MNAAFYCLNVECARYCEGQIVRVPKPRPELPSPICRNCFTPLVYGAPSEFVDEQEQGGVIR